MKCEIVKYHKNPDDTYLIKGVLYEDYTHCFYVWIAQTNDWFVIDHEDHLQIFSKGSPHFSGELSDQIIQNTIRKNRLVMLLNQKTSSVIQDIRI